MTFLLQPIHILLQLLLVWMVQGLNDILSKAGLPQLGGRGRDQLINRTVGPDQAGQLLPP